MSLLEKPPSIVLRTRRNDWDVPNVLRKETPKEILDSMKELFDRERPRAKLRSLTGRYNCIGLVVASRRVWVEPEFLMRILREDGYRQLNSMAEAGFGDLVVYRK